MHTEVLDSTHSNTFEILLNSREAAALLRIHPKTLLRNARHGLLRGYQYSRKWFFRASDLDAWVKGAIESDIQSRRVN